MTTRRKDVLPLESWREMAPTAFETAMSNLPEREREIIEFRYILGDNSSCTLEGLAREFEVSRERVRQLEDRAFRRLPTLMGAALNSSNS